MASVLVVEHLGKHYGDYRAVKDISFSVEEGEVFGILGPNGAGKTTVVESLQGLRRIDSGSACVLGLDPMRDVVELRRRIGSQLQESALPDRMKVWEALELVSSLLPGGPSWESVMEQWGLSDKRDAIFSSLSGGQQQRLLVALALVNGPELVFLDEMTTGLDPAARRIAWDLIRQVRDIGTTVVLVTHFMDEAEALCDRLIVMDAGEVIAEGTPQGLIDRSGGDERVLFTLDGADLAWLSTVPTVSYVASDRGHHEVRGRGPVFTNVAVALNERGLTPVDLRSERSTLEDVYLALTGTENGGQS